jgi:uncharacterized repeat protein (TIGR04138 family)
MSKQHEKPPFDTLVRNAEYPSEAFKFVQQGLAFTVERVHGRISEPEELLHKRMAKKNIDFARLCELYEAGQLKEDIAKLIEQIGGIEKINRHVTGEQLCWGLRELALRRWGMLAPMVLRKWRIKSTTDFGKIVFFLVEHNELQKQPDDSLDDFDNVYDFRSAFQPDFTAEA